MLLLMVVLLHLILGLSQVPLIGFLLILSVPALSAGVLQALHTAAQGGAPSPSLLFVPLTTRGFTGRFWGLGGLMVLAGVFVIMTLMPSADLLPDEEVLLRIQQGDVEALNLIDVDLMRRLVYAFLVGLLIMGAMVYTSVPLIWFHNRRLGSAVADGLKAMLINWKAFLLLGLLISAIFVPFAVVIIILIAGASGQGFMSMVSMAISIILALVFQLILYGTQYCAFRDIFGMNQPAQASPEDPDDSQLVA